MHESVSVSVLWARMCFIGSRSWKAGCVCVCVTVYVCSCVCVCVSVCVCVCVLTCAKCCAISRTAATEKGTDENSQNSAYDKSLDNDRPLTPKQ